MIYGVAAMALAFAALTAAFSADAARRASQPRRQQLIELISSRETQVSEMERDLRLLRRSLDREVEAAGLATATEQAAAEASKVLALQAGAIPVEGRGLTVTMADSARVPGPNEDASLYRIHDVDLQLVVNALFSIGAEAVGVNGQRVVATTAIRGAGETILVNFRPLVPPYVVTAIGPTPGPLEEHPVARRLTRWQRLFGLGFQVTPADDLQVPAYGGQVPLRHARPGRPPAAVTPGGDG